MLKNIIILSAPISVKKYINKKLEGNIFIIKKYNKVTHK